jgi:hypothetical protein
MVLRIENPPHGAVPVIVCDYCRTRIHAARDGNYEWAGICTEPGKRMARYFLHKWCSPAHEAQNGIVLGSMEMAVLLPYLADGLQLNWDEASIYAELMSEVGPAYRRDGSHSLAGRSRLGPDAWYGRLVLSEPHASTGTSATPTSFLATPSAPCNMPPIPAAR